MKTIEELREENERLRQQLLMEGKDAPLTDMIYGKTPEEFKDPTDVMPQNNGMLQGITDPLQKLINQFVVKCHAWFGNILAIGHDPRPGKG